MTRQDIKLEETFLENAREQSVPLKFTLGNKERTTGTISSVSRYDISIAVDGAVVVLPKKEVFHISPESPVLGEGFFAGPEESLPASPVLKSKVQDEFLSRYITEKTLALLLLNNGDELRGVVEGYDGFTICIRTTRGQTLVYKHGICSIGPGYRRQGARHADRTPDRRDAK